LLAYVFAELDEEIACYFTHIYLHVSNH
jgi:hypothetical protein